jgi:hypothetical protein
MRGAETGRSRLEETKRLMSRGRAALGSPSLAVLAAYLIRMSLLWWIHRDRDAFQYQFFPTSHEAWDIAWSIAMGKGFSSPLAGMHGPTAWLAPGYPVLLALGLKLLHMDIYGARILGLALNCTLSALTCWPIYAIGKKIANHETGLVSCWVWVFLPTSILFPLEWLWDQSFSAFFLAWLVYMTLNLPEKPSTPHGVGYGLLWSAAILMNPALGILLPFFLVWVAGRRRKKSLPWRLQSSVAVLVFFLCLLPWTTRNYAAFGQLVPIKSNFGLEFWLGNNPSVKRSWSPWKHPVGDHEEMRQLLQLGEAAYMHRKQEEAIGFIEAHPATFLKSSFDHFVDTWTAAGDIPTDRWVIALHARTPYLWFSAIFSLLAFAGLLLGCRFLGAEIIPLLITLLVFPLPYYIAHSGLRYRHPIEPVMTVLAAYALVWVYSAVFVRWAPRSSQTSAQSP